MKHSILISLFAATAFLHAIAQNQQPEIAQTDTVFSLEELDILPVFPGGETEFQKFLSENVNYISKQNGKSTCATFAFQFVVYKDGSIKDVKILKGDPEVAEGIVRILEGMPRWKPGERNGKPQSVKFTLPVKFNIR